MAAVNAPVPSARELLDGGNIPTEPGDDCAMLAARVEAVLDEHTPQSWGRDGQIVCSHCRYGEDQDPWVTWPCLTVRLLNGERP